jgi:antitoxin component of MazEF toxin-antitoxin module
MTEVNAVVRKAGNSIDLRLPKREARRLGLTEGRRLRIRIEDVEEVADLVGVLKGRVSAKALHAATNEDEDLD